jgi:hypothetical protein
MREEYHKIIGESALFDRGITLWLEGLNIEEQRSLAKRLGADIAPYAVKLAPIKQELDNLGPLIWAEIQQAQRDADRRAQNAASFANTLGAVIGGTAGALAGSSAVSGSAPAYQAPALAPTGSANCVIVPAMRSTVTGQPYIGTSDQVRCR